MAQVKKRSSLRSSFGSNSLSTFSITAIFVAAVVAAVITVGIPSRARADLQDIRFTYDLSASAGSNSWGSYSEVSLGLNTYFSDWFVWRNAGFTRMGTGYGGVYGLDTSARFQYDVGDPGLGFHAFGGPGYRFALSENSVMSGQKSESAPFAEAGFILRLGGLSLGFGLKTVFNQLINQSDENETQYFVILSGGGSL